jgi:hypothetical protein
MARVPIAIILGLIGLLSGASPAFGHGPCGCTGPAFEGENAPEVEAAPGDRLVIMESAIEVVWNPDPDDLRIGAFPAIADDQVETVRTEILARSETPKRHVVRVPDSPDGRYLMVVYDGSEGGQHYTWDHVRLSGPQRAASSAPAPRVPEPPAGDARPWAWMLAAALGGMIVGLLIGRSRRQEVTSGGDA